ncbi:MAG: hypothetical protein J6O55_01880, partial [Lachnospiraceae bacterium]|nr:hypothetical protein [Lachnospiraceae bacterium]
MKKKLAKVMAAAVMTLSMSTNVFAADAGYINELKSRIAQLEQVEKELTAAAEKDPQQNSALAALKGQLLVYRQDLQK